jgi:hypothetical protein
MKKIFTLIAVALCAMSVNAQETLAISESETYSNGQELSTANCSVTLGIDESGWTVKGGTVGPFTAYVSGGKNPKDDNGSGYKPETANLPTNGTYYILSPKTDGTIEVGMVLNTGKNFYVVNGDGTAMETSKFTLTNNDNTVVTLDENNQVAEKFYGTVSFAATANSKYYVFCSGSKLGFYGYIFTAAASGDQDDQAGISSATANVGASNAPVFNLAGQRVGKEYKGVVVKNGRKYVQK